MTVLQMSLMGGMMVLAFALLRLVMGKHLPRRSFLWMWTAAVVRLLLPVRLASRWSVFNLLTRTERVVMPDVLTGAVTPAGEAENMLTSPAGTVALETTVMPSTLIVIWITGMVLVGGYLLLAWLYWHRKFSGAVAVQVSGLDQPDLLRRSWEIRELEGLRTPLTYGIFHPVILLPAGQINEDEEQLRCILMHEYVHIRRFDAVRKLFLAIVLTIHWFNPTVWLLVHLANRDIELLCDEQALRRLGDAQRKTYALALLKTAERGKERIPLCSFFGKPMIEERILMITQKKNITVFAAVFAAILLVGVTTAFATAAEKTEEPPYRGTAEAVDVETPPVVAKPIEKGSANLVWPAEGGDIVTSFYGRKHPITGVAIDHITIAGEKGSNVVAVADGTIIDSGFQSNWGNYLEIDHGDGVVTFYTHLEETLVHRDTIVEQGEVIGTLGQSGTATGPCLGFYLSRNGETEDPMPWFEG